MITNFTEKDVPDQSGKVHFITGANTGIGFEAAKVLAQRGARVLLGCRSREKAEAARNQILSGQADADVALVDIDLSDLDSVRRAAEEVQKEPKLDVLINNAGIMMPPLQRTAQGFEAQFGVNHLGPFLLTELLLSKIEQEPGSRVVLTSSNAHKAGKILFDDLAAEKRYGRLERYSMSKLANLLHMNELDRRLRERASQTIAVGAHPGASMTELGRHLPSWSLLLVRPMRMFLNSPPQAAWPTLLAATAPGVSGGEYFGPSGLLQFSGPARQVETTAQARDGDLAKRLWDVSVSMTQPS